MTPQSTTVCSVGPPNSVPPPRSCRKNTRTFAAMSAIVTYGVRRVGMLSFRGNTRRRLRGGGERTYAGAILGDVLVGVVAGPHERPGGDVVEAERVRGVLERLELVRVPVAHDGQVALGRAEVLADGEDLDVVGTQVLEGGDDLIVRLAEPHHEAG